MALFAVGIYFFFINRNRNSSEVSNRTTLKFFVHNPYDPKVRIRVFFSKSVEGFPLEKFPKFFPPLRYMELSLLPLVYMTCIHRYAFADSILAYVIRTIIRHTCTELKNDV